MTSADPAIRERQGSQGVSVRGRRKRSHVIGSNAGTNGTARQRSRAPCRASCRRFPRPASATAPTTCRPSLQIRTLPAGDPEDVRRPDDRVGAERGADERQPDKRQHAADLRVARYRRPQWLQWDRVNDGQPRQVSEERPLEAGGPRVLEPTVVLLPHGARRRVTA